MIDHSDNTWGFYSDSFVILQAKPAYHIVENFVGGKPWRMGKTMNLQKKLWQISEIVCYQVKLAISRRKGWLHASKQTL